jgi:hypothetical protein
MTTRIQRGPPLGAYQLRDPVACRTELIDLYVGASAGGGAQPARFPGAARGASNAREVRDLWPGV